MASKKRKYRETISGTFGGAMVDFDYQVLRNLPPPEELARAGEETRGLAGQDGDLRIDVPDERESDDAPSAEPTSR